MMRRLQNQTVRGARVQFWLLGVLFLFGCTETNTETTVETSTGPDAKPAEDTAVQLDAGPPPRTTGFIAAWTDAPAMPASFESHALIAIGSHLYALGGWNQTDGTRTAVYVRSDGSWRETSALPRALQHHGVVAHGGHIFVFGGDDGFGGNVSSEIYRARVLPDGSLESWETAGALDAPRSLHATVLVGDRVFLIGGIASFPGGAPVTLRSVVSATIDANGSVGTFTAAGDLPEARGWLAAANWGDQVYVAGGILDFGTGALSNSVLAADATGAILAFRKVATLSPRMRLGLIATQGQLVAAGGLTGSTIARDVSSATIAADGSLGGWDSRADLPEGRYAFGMTPLGDSVVISGGFYQVGAFDTRDGTWAANTSPP